MKSNNVWTKPYALLAAGAVLGVIAFAAINRTANAQRPYVYQAPMERASLQAPSAPPSDLQALDDFYSELSEYATEAVVHISTSPERAGRMAMQGGDGSGFFLTEDGWIVTNDHVVRSANEVDVVMADGRTLKGKVHRTNDESLDIALVKVDGENMPVLKFANSDGVRPGQIVIAVGSPFGLENTVTFGHVSAIGRLGQAGDGFSDIRYYSGMIQTDASINPGNSGGPLINVNGEVIGVNTSIYSTSGANAGIGFAIPANVVRAVANELMSKGKFDRGVMGLYPRDLKPFESKDRNGLHGAFVQQVQEGDAAAKAGLKPGDVIVRIDDEPIQNEIDLRVALYKRSPNQKIDVTYVRDGKQGQATMTLKAPAPVERQAPQQQFQPNGPNFFEMPPFPENNERPKLGVYLYDVDDTTREQYDLPNGLEGAVVYRVAEDSLAAKAGLKPGDVITGLGGNAVKSAEDVANGLGRFNFGDEVAVKYVRIQDGKAVERTAKARLR
jgi:serine protease Do